LTAFHRYAVIVLLALSFSLFDIALAIHCDRRAVRRWVGRLIEEDDINLDDRQRSGRPPTLSREEETAIVDKAKEWPFVTPGMIKSELKLTVSNRTIDRVLIKAGLYGRIAMKSYPYTDTQKQIRLAFANNLKGKGNDFWDHVLFTDESSSQLGLHGNRIYVRRPRGDYYKWVGTYVWKDESKIKTGKLKFFAGFSSTGKTKLYFYEKMTGDQMINIINTNILPESHRIFGNNGWYILHDNDK
jgi:transposase